MKQNEQIKVSEKTLYSIVHKRFEKIFKKKRLAMLVTDPSQAKSTNRQTPPVIGNPPLYIAATLEPGFRS